MYEKTDIVATRERLAVHKKLSLPRRVGARALGRYPNILERIDVEEADINALPPCDRIAHDIKASVHNTMRATITSRTIKIKDASNPDKKLAASGYRPTKNTGITLDALNNLIASAGKADKQLAELPSWIGLYKAPKDADADTLGGIYYFDKEAPFEDVHAQITLTRENIEALSESQLASLQTLTASTVQETAKAAANNFLNVI